MRIIAGIFKSRRLAYPKSKSIRPTMDRVREALFSSLGERIEKTVVLDLFAGSGSFGFEALSRGASSCVFVDTHPRALACVKENIHTLQVDAYTSILALPAEKAIGFLKKKKRQFDVVFMDPPYGSDGAKKTLMKLEQFDILAPKSLVVLEECSSEVIQIPDTFEVINKKVFGDTQLIILEKR